MFKTDFTGSWSDCCNKCNEWEHLVKDREKIRNQGRMRQESLQKNRKKYRKKEMEQNQCSKVLFPKFLSEIIVFTESHKVN